MFKENKERFISTINVEQYPYKYWDNLFKKVEPIEEMYDKDLFDFSKKEIVGLYKYFDTKSFDYLLVMNFNLIKYAQWALQEALIKDGQNHFSELTNEEIYECINKFGMEESIITRERLESLLNTIASARDRFILIALFEGIKGKSFCELINANINDIDFNKKKMKLSTGRVVDISDTLIAIATEANLEETYVAASGKKTYKLYGDVGSLYKSIRKDPSEANEIKIVGKIIRNILDTHGVSKYVTANTIFTSGLIHRINQFADQDDTTAQEVLSNEEHLEYLKNQYGYNKVLTYKFLFRYKNFLR